MLHVDLRSLASCHNNNGNSNKKKEAREAERETGIASEKDDACQAMRGGSLDTELAKFIRQLTCSRSIQVYELASERCICRRHRSFANKNSPFPVRRPAPSRGMAERHWTPLSVSPHHAISPIQRLFQQHCATAMSKQ